VSRLSWQAPFLIAWRLTRVPEHVTLRGLGFRTAPVSSIALRNAVASFCVEHLKAILDHNTRYI